MRDMLMCLGTACLVAVCAVGLVIASCNEGLKSMQSDHLKRLSERVFESRRVPVTLACTDIGQRGGGQWYCLSERVDVDAITRGFGLKDAPTSASTICDTLLQKRGAPYSRRSIATPYVPGEPVGYLGCGLFLHGAYFANDGSAFCAIFSAGGEHDTRDCAMDSNLAPSSPTVQPGGGWPFKTCRILSRTDSRTAVQQLMRIASKRASVEDLLGAPDIDPALCHGPSGSVCYWLGFCGGDFPTKPQLLLLRYNDAGWIASSDVEDVSDDQLDALLATLPPRCTAIAKQPDRRWIDVEACVGPLGPKRK